MKMSSARLRVLMGLLLFSVLCLVAIVIFWRTRTTGTERQQADIAVRADADAPDPSDDVSLRGHLQPLSEEGEKALEEVNTEFIAKAREMWKPYVGIRVGMDLASLKRARPGLTYEYATDWFDGTTQHDPQAPHEVFEEVVEEEPVMGLGMYERCEISYDRLSFVLTMLNGEREAIRALWLTSFEGFHGRSGVVPSKLVVTQRDTQRPMIAWEVAGSRFGLRYSQGTGIAGDHYERDEIALIVLSPDDPKSDRFFAGQNVSDDERDRLFAEVGVPFGVEAD